MRDSRNPRHGGPRHIVSDRLGTERSFDTHRGAVQVASSHCLLSFRNGQTHSPNMGQIVRTPISSRSRKHASEMTRVGIISTMESASITLSLAGLRLVIVRKQTCQYGVSEVGARSIFDRIAAGTSSPTFRGVVNSWDVTNAVLRLPMILRTYRLLSILQPYRLLS